MSIESDADRAVFVNPSDFGSAATYYTAISGSPFALNGVFDTSYFSADIGAGVPIEGMRPRFLCRTADLPTPPKHGDSLLIGLGRYLVREIHDDATGMTELTIELVEIRIE